MAKTKDLFLNIAANPDMTLEDLASVGLTSENTMLLDRASYASNEKVQDMFRDADGNFDEQEFNTVYDIAEQSYNILATDDVNLNLMDVTAYDVDNIFVDPSKRRQNNVPYAIKLPNPDRLNTGVTRIGKTSERQLSQDEIAQSQKVLLNPVEAANGEKPIYGESPNDSWFKDFWDTRVMAAWDEDGTHIDPVTGREVQHHKGDLKLNENGTYYYENLDGRSVYGKRILNKFNTLTTDGSSWNKYDFFDSDDIEQKSIGGSIAKNLALVGSMFIPYVGWGVAAASVAHQSAGLFATLGKMLAGVDNPTLNNIEGWVKSTDRRNLKTEYAQQNMWCWENFIDLIGDTTAQLREQRAIFKFAPGLIKGDFKALNEKAMDDYAKDLADKYMKNATQTKFRDLIKLAKQQNPENWREQLSLLTAGARDIFSAKAQKAARDYVTNYYKLGEPIAKAYMTAITVQDTFGEAIEAGASNNEATLLTLGYAAAEAALLSTDLGKWIMPELRADRQRYKMIAKKLLEVPQETREMSKQIARLSGEAKKDWAKRLFNIGKDIARAEYSTMAKTVGSVLASGLGEGVEEVSEELLSDFSKSCFNLVQQLQGDDVRMAAWQDMGNRYAMSFVGGIMGGGINAAASDYKVNKDLVNMNSQQALQQLVYMTRNDEMDDFWKVISKTELASKELSTQLNDSGTGYKPGTKEDNQDLEAKRALRKQISMIESIINAENAKLNDGGLLSMLIQADPSLKDLDPVKEYRMRALSNSATAGRFLNIWNTITTDIVKNRLEQNQIMAKYGDSSQEKYSEEDKQELKRLSTALKELQARKDAMLNGERTREYVRDALFEMSHAVSEVWDDWCTEIRFAEAKTGKKYSDISEEEKKTLKEQYEQLKSSNQYAEKVHELADIYEALAISASQGIMNSEQFLEQVRKNSFTNVQALNKLASKRLSILTKKTKEDDGASLIQSILDDDFKDDLVVFANSQNLLNILQQLDNQAKLDIANIVRGRSEEELTPADINAINNIILKREGDDKLAILNSVFDTINTTYDEFIQAGFIHPETKNMLTQMLYSLSNYANIGNDRALDSFDDTLADVFWSKMESLTEKANQIEELSNTPILENLKQFQLSTNADQTVLDLINYLIIKERQEKKDISAFQLDNFTLDQFKAARQFLEMYRATIVGARFDNVDIDSIVGFNTTLNEVSGTNETPKLAEINAQTADLILEDINTLLKRLDYAEGLHRLNTGNKFNVQSKTALNKQFILHNKLRTFVSILEDDDEWKDKDGESELSDLLTAIREASTLNANSGFGQAYEARNFALSPEQKTELERESIRIQKALHSFLVKHVDGSDASIKKLAKLLTYDNFKGLIRENTGFLDQSSQDIDDSAFVWWLAATAALNPHDFYNNYRTIIGEEVEGERPIAPIPTQELGVFALTASVVNGDMFKTFGKALRQSLSTFWESASETDRMRIRTEYGANILVEDKDKLYFKNSDFLPNFDNIVFVEGIAGSGKSTGVLKTWSRLMAKVNPDFVGQKIIFAHTDKGKAEGLAKSTSFTNYEAHDHDSLLSYMSPNYTHQESVNGTTQYEMGKDVRLYDDGILRAPWEVRALNPNDVPKVIVIDEWSHYNQLEQELIQRFAQTYGVSVITMGDYDQLTPSASIVKKSGTSTTTLLDMTPSRNMTPRVAKLGVSMRTDNEIKNGNMYRMLAWRQNHVPTVDLHYYEDETGIYGDKNYNVGDSYGDKLEAIKVDVKKMVSTLRTDEKIGYIYSDTNSELYKWLTTQEGVKEHIQPYLEKDAHGREAQYYIVENNRTAAQDAVDYFNSVYTGITRSEQGSIVITGVGMVGGNDGISFKTVQDTEMLPNTFTDEGTRIFSKNRKDTLDSIFGSEEVTPFTIKERTRVPITLNPASEIDESSIIEEDISEPEITPEPEEAPKPEPEPEPVVEPEVTPIEEISPEIAPEPEIKPWIGPLSKNQILYRRDGIAKYAIFDEEGDQYVLRDLSTGLFNKVSKELVEQESFLKLPSEEKLFNVGDKVITPTGVQLVDKVVLSGPKDSPMWTYFIGDQSYTQLTLKNAISEGKVLPYTYHSESEEMPVKETVYDMEGASEYEELVNESVEARESEQQPEAVTVLDDDIVFKLLGFTFNNQYLADLFDEDGNIVVTDRDQARIDNGYGLYKMNPSLYKSKEQIKQDLGFIRRHLEFSSNQDIVQQIQRLTRTRGLSIRWAFVSKASSEASGKYGRFNISKAPLEYMGKEDADVPQKTISAIIYNSNNEPVLEIPIITLQSPHSIFRELLNNGIAKDITNIWNFGPKNSGETYDLLKRILYVIDTKYANHPGYQDLGNVIKLWLFSSNGVKMLPEDWNLGQSGINLGNFYITHRQSDSIVDHDFSGEWVDLDTLGRKDRFISSILMNNTDVYVDQATDKQVSTFRPYVPYVLISDDPNITDDAKAAKRFLEQQLNPSLKKTVKAYPVVPPEASVKSYIEAMHRILTGQSTNEPFGKRNKYAAYRIWEAILESPDVDFIMSQLDSETKQFVKDTIERMRKAQEITPQREGESKLAYKKRLATAQNPILSEFVMVGNDRVEVFQKLRKALVDTCMYVPFGTDVVGNEEIINKISQACKQKGITGILCKAQFEGNQAGVAIGGFAYKVRVQDTYRFPGQGSFRVFGKIDSPTYDLSLLKSELRAWAKDATLGVTRYDRNSGEERYYDNIWEFMNDDAAEFYLPEVGTSRINLNGVLQHRRDLLARLGIPEYNIDISELGKCATESEAYAKVESEVHEKYLESNGAFIIKDSSGFKYGNIITDATPEFNNYKFVDYAIKQGGYVLRFMDLNTNTIQEIDIELDPRTNSFKLIPQTSSKPSSNLNIGQIKQEITSRFSRSPLSSDPTFSALLNDILKFYDEKSNTVDLVAVESVLAGSNLDAMVLRGFRRTLRLSEIENNQSLDECINPIKIRFK